MHNQSFIFRKRFFLCLITLFISFTGYSQTIINSDITTNTTWTVAGSPYQVMEDISIESGITLTIDPGVRVQVDTFQIITLKGTLNANGTPTDSIYFSDLNETVSDSIPLNQFNPGIWKGFECEDGSSINMEYVRASRSARLLGFFNATSFQANFKNCYFRENNWVFITDENSGSTIYIDSCRFEYSQSPMFQSSNFEINESLFINNERGAGGNNTIINGCSFINFDLYGAYIGHSGKLTNSYFGYTSGFIPTAAEFAILAYVDSFPTTSVTIENNIVHAKNGIGIYGGGNDSLIIKNNEICVDSLIISVPVFSSQPLDFSKNCWCSIDVPDIYSRIYDDSVGAAANVNILPMDTSCVPDMVYPGDANHDQIANNIDLLPIGLHYGKTGPSRTNGSISWIPQIAVDWGDTLISTGFDIKHVDCNGDGTINDDDTLAISLNYLQTHTSNKKSNRSVDGIPLFFDMPAGPFNTGDTVHIPLIFGTPDTQAVDVYGLAFSIQYDTSLVSEGASKVDFSNSWLGGKGTDLLTFSTEFTDLGRIDLSLVRNDQIEMSGFGQIAEIIVVMDDDIFKKEVPFKLDIVKEYAIDADENVLDLDPKQGISSIEDGTDGISTYLSQSLKLYPNPAQEEVVVSIENTMIQSVSLINVTGQVIHSQVENTVNSVKINLQDYPKGLYFVKVETKEGTAIKKLVVR